MPEWNAQQIKAIETKDKNVLVSASAGSGKTTVLIARLMDKVTKEQISINAICAMTFTEAAANEMKKRLAIELQSALDQSVDKEEIIYLRQQLTNIQTAHISTIHSFCLSILQDYYYIIGLSKKRIEHVMDNSEMTFFQQQALKASFEKQYQQKDSTFLELTQMFSARPENDEALRSMIQALATLSSSKSNSEEWLASLVNSYQNIQHIEDLSQEIQDNFFEYLLVETKRYEEMMEKIHNLYEIKYSSEEKKSALVKAKLAYLPQLFEPLNSFDYNEFRQSFINSTHIVIPPSPDKFDSEYSSLRKELLALEDHLLALLFREEEFIQNIAYLVPYIAKLVEMCCDYRMAYAKLKEKVEMIDFDDMEHFALAILQANNGAISDLYRQQFIEIMVDEFQDSNDVQNTLVSLISRDNNVFRVGDIKQSIYGFRHALPDLMKGLIEHIGDNDEVIYLSNNYRSKQMIVDFNNELFKQLMNLDGFSCSYSSQDDVNTGIPSQLTDNVPICFHAIFHEEIKKEENLIIAKNMLKANYIAHQIVEIHDQEQRAWSDFVVLVRGNARKDNLKAAFDELHIPYFIDIKYGFYQSTAVQIILSALHALLDPHNDIAFCAVMMSPLFHQNAQDLANIRLKKEKKESYYHYLHEHPFSDFTLFEELRHQIHSLSLCEMLNHLFNINNYYGEHTSLQEKTNLDLLFEKAIQFENDSATGIEAFLSQIEQIKDAQTAEAIPIGFEANVVRVMSIHQSKGLQFPIVFLWSNDSQTPIEFKDFCICDDKLGLAMKAMKLPQRNVFTTIQRIAMEHKKDKAELEEEMRILYVATTRAQQQLHIVDCVLSLEPYKHPLTMCDIYRRCGYTSWILQTYLSQESSLFTLKEIHHLWQAHPLEKEAIINQPIELYSMDTPTWLVATASNKKATKLPGFQPKANLGTSYGTHMHKMVEMIHNQQPSKEIILSIAQTLHFELNDRDIQALLSLYQNPIFSLALKGDCHFELPYTVHKEFEILHGYMDFVSIKDQEIILIDFKTDSESLESDFITLYQEQLNTYQEAMHILYPQKNIKAYIYAFHLQQMISV